MNTEQTSENVFTYVMDLYNAVSYQYQLLCKIKVFQEKDQKKLSSILFYFGRG